MTDTAELVQRLRKMLAIADGTFHAHPLLLEAADALEREKRRADEAEHNFKIEHGYADGMEKQRDEVAALYVAEGKRADALQSRLDAIVAKVMEPRTDLFDLVDLILSGESKE